MPRSAIDHVLVNNKLMEHFKVMQIDENRDELNISDHNFVKTRFNIGRGEKTTWKQPRSGHSYDRNDQKSNSLCDHYRNVEIKRKIDRITKV